MDGLFAVFVISQKRFRGWYRQNVCFCCSYNLVNTKRIHVVGEHIILCKLIHHECIWYIRTLQIYYIYTTHSQKSVSVCACACTNKIKVILPFWLFILNMYMYILHALVYHTANILKVGYIHSARSKRVKIKTIPDKFFYCIYSSVKLEYHVEILLHLHGYDAQNIWNIM